jgi:hypothetical protein
MSARTLLLVALLPCLALPAASANDALQYRLTPYAWFAGLKGTVATIPGAPAAPIDISPSEALDDSEAGVMLVFEVKKGQHGLLADLLYTDTRSDEELLPPPIGLTLRSITKSTILSLAYQREILRRDGAIVDVMVGARYWNIDSDLRFGGGSGLLAGKRVTHDESWIDPAIGIKGRAPLGNTRFYVEGGAGLGGFGIGSDLFYDLNAAIGYQWTPAIGTAIGYRMFDVDYEDGGFVYDARQEGWQLALTWAF